MFLFSSSIVQTLSIVALGLALLPVVRVQEPDPSESWSSESEEDGEDCGLDAVPNCFQPVREILDCRNSWNNERCVIDVPKLELLCNYIKDGLNNCTVNIIGTSCTKINPKHSYFLKWLPSLNSLIFNFCSTKNLQVVADAFESKCLEEPIFQCILETENHVDWLDVITSQMHPDVCINIDLKTQDCSVRHPLFSKPCKEFVQIVLNATESFLEKSGCYNQQLVTFVPLNGKTEVQTIDNKDSEEDYEQSKNDRECFLDPGIVSNCFTPLIEQWKCYFNFDRTCNFSLKTLCATSKESLNSCTMNLMGYGCEENKVHQYFLEWLGAFNSIQNELCGSSSSIDVGKIQLRYFSGLSSCWAEFFTCFNYHGNVFDIITLMTLKMTPKTCSVFSEKIQFCMWKGFLDFSKNHCDPLLDKLSEINKKFLTNPSCTNNGRTQSFTSSSTRNTLRISFVILGFVFMFRIIL